MPLTPQGRPSEALLIKASVLARILGLRLLRLEATITLAPGDLRGPGGPLRTVAVERDQLPRAALERNLAEAVRGMDEGAELLARARRDRL